MAKYILQSGGISRGQDQGAAFYQELVSGLGSKPRLLLCAFAQPRETWERKHSVYVQAIQNSLGQAVQPMFDLAYPDRIREQVGQADALYFHGGDDHLIQYWLKELDLPTLWRDKVVATNSGSSDAIVSSFWTCDWRACMNGLGIVPIKFIPHYGSTAYDEDDPRGPIDWVAAKRELAEFGDTPLPIYALPEGDYTVFND